VRYPTRGGLIIPPAEIGLHAPTPEDLGVRRLTSNHHAYFQKAQYHDIRFRAVFRNLVTNVYPLFVPDHARLHEEFDPPKRPKDELMVDVIEEYLSLHGVVECIREKRTREVYQIQPEEWVAIKKGYRRAA